MTGGLLQLVTSGIEDAPLIEDPDITFFNLVYLRHSNFSLLQSKYYLGNKKFNQKIEQKIPSAGDLLSKIYFKASIPSFDLEVYNNRVDQIVLENVNIPLVNSLNMIEKYYNNENIYFILDDNEIKVFSERMIDYYFRKSGIKITENVINFTENEIISKYLSLWNSNNTKFYFSENLIIDPNQIYSLIRIFSNNLESFLLEYFKLGNNIYFGNIINGYFWKEYLRKYYNNLFFLSYQNNYIIQNNSKYFNITIDNESEAIKYLNYFISLNANDSEELNINLSGFDLDLTYSYLLLNNQTNKEVILSSFDDTIKNNILFLSRVISSLFPTFISSTDYNMFTLYRVFGLKENNKDIDDDITINTFTKDSLWGNKFGKIYDTLGKIFNIPFYFWIKEMFYKMKTELLLNISNIEIEDKKGLYNIINGISCYYDKLNKKSSNTTKNIVNFTVSRDSLTLFSLVDSFGISLEVGMIVSHPNITSGTTVIKIDSTNNKISLSSKNGLDSSVFNSSFTNLPESNRQISFYFEGNVPINLTITNFEIATELDSLRLETVDNILVDMIMLHNDLDPGTLVSEVDLTNLTVKVKPKLADSVFISNTIVGSVIFQEFTNRMSSQVKSISIGSSEDSLTLTTVTNLSVGMKLIHPMIKSGTIIKSVDETNKSIKLNFNLLSRYYLEVENNSGIVIGMKVKHPFIDTSTEVLKIGYSLDGSNYPNRILISSNLHPKIWTDDSFNGLSKSVEFISNSNQIVNQTIISFGRSLMNNLINEDIIFISNEINFSNITDKYYIEKNSLVYNIQKVSESFPYRPNTTSVINPADLYNLYSYLVYDLYDIFINNNIFTINPFL